MSKSEDVSSSGAFNVSNGALSQEEVRKIKELLINHPETAASQLGKYRISIAQGSGIHIGDTVSQSLDEQSIKMLVAAIEEANESTSGKVYKHLQKMPLETLKVDVDTDTVNRVNLDLRFVGNLETKGYLTDTQKQAFLDLKQEIHSLNEFDRKLEELHNAAKSLLEETRLELTRKVKELKQKGRQMLDSEVLDSVVEQQACKVKELQILEDFIHELQETKEVADWIDGARKVMARRFGREALKYFPDLEESTNPEKIGDFCFSIYQFLEQVAHSLRWSRRNILDNPGIPLVLDYIVYEKAFLLIREKICNSLPSRFSDESKNLVCECIDYLTDQLFFYDQE